MYARLEWKDSFILFSYQSKRVITDKYFNTIEHLYLNTKVIQTVNKSIVGRKGYNKLSLKLDNSPDIIYKLTVNDKKFELMNGRFVEYLTLDQALIPFTTRQKFFKPTLDLD